MAGKYGSNAVTITYDDAGGIARVVTALVMELGGAKIEVDQESSESFGDSWAESNPTGTRKAADIPMSGFWDTTATTGSHAIFTPVDADADPNGATRTLVIVFGDGKTFTVETRLISGEVSSKLKQLSRFAAVIRPSGAAVWS